MVLYFILNFKCTHTWTMKIHTEDIRFIFETLETPSTVFCTLKVLIKYLLNELIYMSLVSYI